MPSSSSSSSSSSSALEPLRQNEGVGLEEMGVERESSVKAVLRDYNMVSIILSFLHTPRDRLSATLVCHIWHEAAISQSWRISARCRSLLPSISRRFSHITALDLSSCFDQLQNEDLLVISKCFPHLRTLIFGHRDIPQHHLSDSGFQHFAYGWKALSCISLCYLTSITDASIVSIVAACTGLKSVSVGKCRELTVRSLMAILGCKNLEELSFEGLLQPNANNPMPSSIACQHLLKACLSLGPFNFSPLLNVIASGCPEIQEISLKGSQLDLYSLVKCSSLTCFRVETHQKRMMDDVVIEIATRNNNMKELALLNHFAPLNDASVCEIIRRCKRLEALHIDATLLTEASLLFLMECKTLRSLSLSYFRSTGSGLAEIGLCGLELVGFSLRHGSSIRDIELQTLMQANCASLHHLDLQGCNGPSSIGFSAIGACSNLLSLDLGCTHVDDMSLMAISCGAKLLRHLSLVKCEGIIDAGAVSGFTSLESLSMDQCHCISDRGLGSIAQGCRFLAHLSIAYTRVTDRGLFHLTKCHHLRSLKIPYCRDVKGPGIVAIVNTCAWFRYIALSHHFRGTKTHAELEGHHCVVYLEVDDLALVPFDFNI